MTIEYVRRTYGVPATRGGLVHYFGQPGRILSATHHLRVLLDDGQRVWLHPTWRVEYQECHEAIADRDGNAQPCDRPAVGYRYDPAYLNEGPYPVCRRHHREPFAEADHPRRYWINAEVSAVDGGAS